MNRIVVSFQGNRFNKGEMYVALSRVKTLAGVQCLYFKQDSILHSEAASREMQRLRNDCRVPIPIQQLDVKPDSLMLGLLNVQCLLSVHQHVLGDQAITSTDIMCFTETWLKPDKEDVSMYGDVIIRKDRSGETKGGGVMIAVKNSHKVYYTVSFFLFW